MRHFPLSGAPREKFSPGLRVAFHRLYAIYSAQTPDLLVIVRVLHGSRDAVALAESGGFEAPDRFGD